MNGKAPREQHVRENTLAVPRVPALRGIFLQIA